LKIIEEVREMASELRHADLNLTSEEMEKIIKKFDAAIPEFSDRAHRVNMSMREASLSLDRLEKMIRENGFMDDEILDYIIIQHRLFFKIVDKIIDTDAINRELEKKEKNNEENKEEKDEDYKIVNEDKVEKKTIIIINVEGGDQ